jgi:hypothetical protein
LRAGNTPKRQGAVVSDEAIHARRAPARDVGRACIGVAWIATGLAALAMTMNRGRPRDDGEVGLVPPRPRHCEPRRGVAIHAFRAPGGRPGGGRCLNRRRMDRHGPAALAMTMNRGRPRDDGEVGLVPPVPVIASPEGAWQSMPFGRRAAVLGGGGASTGAAWIATGLAALAMTMNRGRPRDDGEVGLVPPPSPSLRAPQQAQPRGCEAPVAGSVAIHAFMPPGRRPGVGWRQAPASHGSPRARGPRDDERKGGPRDDENEVAVLR